MTLADKIINFNESLEYKGKLPRGIDVMNPFAESEEIREINRAFYKKYYSDNEPRKLILGINPGRLGAGATGIPFTDTKRLQGDCGIDLASFHTHEPSSVFVYEVIRAYGGPEAFYSSFFINSLSPLGLLIKNKKGNWVNCNYYDYADLYKAMRPYIIENLRLLISMGMETGKVFVLGKKNARFLADINKDEKLFDELVVFDHPRYIVQYRSKYMEDYVTQYLEGLML